MLLTQHQYVMILDTIAVMIDVIGILTATLTPATNDVSTASTHAQIGHKVHVVATKDKKKYKTHTS